MRRGGDRVRLNRAASISSTGGWMGAECGQHPIDALAAALDAWH